MSVLSLSSHCNRCSGNFVKSGTSRKVLISSIN
ncbi:MAG: hypothetical protein ACR2LR_27245 [Hassallia sp.]